MNLNDFIFTLLVAFALGCDAFAVGLALGTKHLDKRASFRLWFHFGLFQFLMPIIGWSIGVSILECIKSFDHWIAFGLMFIIASKMMYESFQDDKEDETNRQNPTRGWMLMGLSVATSMDALGVGFGMGVSKMECFKPALIIGIIASIMTYTGISLGRHMSDRFGKRVETLGALILYVVAFKLLSI